MEYLILVIKSLCLLVPLLLSTAYLTLAERKVIASIQQRVGPNIVGLYGALQPLADGLKLLTKETIQPLTVDSVIFVLAPVVTFTLSLASWAVIPFASGSILADIELGLLFLFALSGLGVYGIILAGWSSMSQFAFMGSIRASAQMISYEVSLGLIMVTVVLFSGSLNLSHIVSMQSLLALSSTSSLLSLSSCWYILPLLPLGLAFFISVLAETNRTPFDLVESESELVAGPFIEYSSVSLFGQFFLAEMSSILMYSTLVVVFFFGGLTLWTSWKVTIIVFGFLLVRAALPRYRYDQLNRIGWRVLLPLSLAMIPFYAGLHLTLDTFPQDSFLA